MYMNPQTTSQWPAPSSGCNCGCSCCGCCGCQPGPRYPTYPTTWGTTSGAIPMTYIN